MLLTVLYWACIFGSITCPLLNFTNNYITQHEFRQVRLLFSYKLSIHFSTAMNSAALKLFSFLIWLPCVISCDNAAHPGQPCPTGVGNRITLNGRLSLRSALTVGLQFRHGHTNHLTNFKLRRAHHRTETLFRFFMKRTHKVVDMVGACTSVLRELALTPATLHPSIESIARQGTSSKVAALTSRRSRQKKYGLDYLSCMETRIA